MIHASNVVVDVRASGNRLADDYTLVLNGDFAKIADALRSSSGPTECVQPCR